MTLQVQCDRCLQPAHAWSGLLAEVAMSVATSSDERFLALCSNCSLQVKCMGQDTPCMYVRGQSGSFPRIAWSTDSAWLASAFSQANGVINIVKAGSWEQLLTIPAHGVVVRLEWGLGDSVLLVRAQINRLKGLLANRSSMSVRLIRFGNG